MNIAFTLKQKKGMHGVFVTTVRGRQIAPVPVYLTNNRIKAQVVMDALTSGLLGRITTIVMKNGE